MLYKLYIKNVLFDAEKKICFRGAVFSQLA